MREGIIVCFCVASLAMLTVGKSYAPVSFFKAYEAYEAALERGDWRRAARFGELALSRSGGQALLDERALVRLRLQVAAAQEEAGNWQRARRLYEAAQETAARLGEADLTGAAEAGLHRAEEAFAAPSLRGPVPSGTEMPGS